ncbi:MAG: hypothetical protein ABIR62_11310 [Dokdonella sp.]|uniref:hypothetical protein n=1 Tax=Dokdonella sp. TaxID=2291710 RepID=UPI003266040E
MSHVVISSFENTDTGDLQAQGEAITVCASEAAAREHVANRWRVLEQSVAAAGAEDPDATFIAWLVIFRMPLDVDNVDEALEDLELVIEETDTPDDPFGELAIAYQGMKYASAAAVAYPQKDALDGLEAWLT